MKSCKAIAAMSLNRVIGRGNQIPWRLPEDFQWFKRMTVGNVVVMGRRTFESLPKPLPRRRTVVLTRDPQRLVETHPGIFGGYLLQASTDGMAGLWHFVPRDRQDNQGGLFVGTDLAMVRPADFPGEVFICGGEQLYREALGACSDLYLTVVKLEVGGDAHFPAFEDDFRLVERIRQTESFDILHYRNRRFSDEPAAP